jgi:hypothetical protein
MWLPCFCFPAAPHFNNRHLRVTCSTSRASTATSTAPSARMGFILACKVFASTDFLLLFLWLSRNVTKAGSTCLDLGLVGGCGCLQAPINTAQHGALWCTWLRAHTGFKCETFIIFMPTKIKGVIISTLNAVRRCKHLCFLTQFTMRGAIRHLRCWC